MPILERRRFFALIAGASAIALAKPETISAESSPQSAAHFQTIDSAEALRNTVDELGNKHLTKPQAEEIIKKVDYWSQNRGDLSIEAPSGRTYIMTSGPDTVAIPPIDSQKSPFEYPMIQEFLSSYPDHDSSEATARLLLGIYRAGFYGDTIGNSSYLNLDKHNNPNGFTNAPTPEKGLYYGYGINPARRTYTPVEGVISTEAHEALHREEPNAVPLDPELLSYYESLPNNNGKKLKGTQKHFTVEVRPEDAPWVEGSLQGAKALDEEVIDLVKVTALTKAKLWSMITYGTPLTQEYLVQALRQSGLSVPLLRDMQTGPFYKEFLIAMAMGAVENASTKSKLFSRTDSTAKMIAFGMQHFGPNRAIRWNDEIKQHYPQSVIG